MGVYGMTRLQILIGMNIRITNPNELREVIAIGLGKLTDKAIEGPALWTAKIRDEKVAAWQVYEDTVDNRQRLHINDE